MFLGSLQELVRQGDDERLKEGDGAEDLLGFGRVLRRVVDALVGSAEAVVTGEEMESNQIQSLPGALIKETKEL